MTTSDEPHRHSVASMTSELLREGAVLVFVFGWLDRATHDRPFFEGLWAAGIICVGSACFVLGVVLERFQPGAKLKGRPP